MTTVTPQQALEMAIEHHRAGRLADAEPIYRQLLALEPENPDLIHLLGLLGCESGHLTAGLALLERSIQLRPLARYYVNYSTRLMTAGRHDDAAAAAEAAIRTDPADPDGPYNLGVVREQQRRFPEAIEAYRATLALTPHYPLALLNLGSALAAAGQPELAIAHYREVLRKDPHNNTVANNLGGLYRDRGELTLAVESYRSALAVNPENALIRNNLAVALKDQGEVEASIAELRHSLSIDPDRAEVQSNLIFTTLYQPGHPGLAAAQAEWDRRFCEPLRRAAPPHLVDRSPERRLRIGYVSADLRNHVVSRTLWPVFAAHDRQAVELVCYSSALPDAQTARFRARAEQWRETALWSDERLAAQIRADGVDILIDLSLHTANHRLLTFARRPAPVQVAWLGYPDTTGLSTMDYWLSDHFLAPADGPEPAFEQPFRLPDAWTIYEPPTAAPEVNTLPASASGRVTFASFNHFAKHSAATWDVWAWVLGAVPDSRLLLLAKSAEQRAAVQANFERRGISVERIVFAEYQPEAPGVGPAHFLSRYHAADIALDPLPYNGMTTTCDALWMGVPVVTLIGDRGISRAGFSIMSNVGLPELAAATADDYVRIAADLARDLPRLAELRATLRARMKASPLVDAPRLARNVEAAFREMWRRWCATLR